MRDEELDTNLNTSPAPSALERTIELRRPGTALQQQPAHSAQACGQRDVRTTVEARNGDGERRFRLCVCYARSGPHACPGTGADRRTRPGAAAWIRLHVLDRLASVECALATRLEGFMLREIADMHAGCAAGVARAPAVAGEVKVACASSGSESGCCGHWLGMRFSLNRYLRR